MRASPASLRDASRPRNRQPTQRDTRHAGPRPISRSKIATRFERDLCELLRIPSVSADSAHRADVRRAAEWVADQFRGLKLDGRTGRDRRPSDRLRRVAPGPRRADGAGLRPLRRAAARSAWTSGFRRRSSRRSATATSTPAARPTTRGRCSRTSRAPRPGSRPRASCRCN